MIPLRATDAPAHGPPEGIKPPLLSYKGLCLILHKKTSRLVMVNPMTKREVLFSML